ncbi:hypothetical protein ABID22_001262, partial [Pontibacter aydingkolensis]
MDLPGEEAGDAREGGFDAFSVVVFEKGHVWLILALAVGLAAAVELNLVTRFQQVLHLIAGVAGVSVEAAAFGQVQGHGLEGGDVDKGAGMDV